jgi:hypothetical protein
MVVKRDRNMYCDCYNKTDGSFALLQSFYYTVVKNLRLFYDGTKRRVLRIMTSMCHFLTIIHSAKLHARQNT